MNRMILALAGAALIALPAAAQQSGPASGPPTGRPMQEQMPGQSSVKQGQTADQGQNQPGANPIADRVRTMGESLRNAAMQLRGETRGQSQPNFSQARVAIEAGQNVLREARQQHGQNENFRRAESELAEAERALQAGQPDRMRVAQQLTEAADAMDRVMPGAGVTSTSAPR
jgi:hypothetical protein